MHGNAIDGLIKNRNKVDFTIVGVVGTSFCFGDVGGSSSKKMFLGINDLVFSDVQYMASIGFRTIPFDRWGGKLSIFNTSLRGFDNGSRNGYREFEFNAKVLGIDAQIEYYFWKSMTNNFVQNSAYLFSGAGVANSQVKFKGELRPNDSCKPNITTPFIPFGIGYNIKFMEKLSFGAELGVQYMFTDYIDGITTKYSKQNDVISYFTFSISYHVFQKDKCRFCE